MISWEVGQQFSLLCNITWFPMQEQTFQQWQNFSHNRSEERTGDLNFEMQSLIVGPSILHYRLSSLVSTCPVVSIIKGGTWPTPTLQEAQSPQVNDIIRPCHWLTQGMLFHVLLAVLNKLHSVASFGHENSMKPSKCFRLCANTVE